MRITGTGPVRFDLTRISPYVAINKDAFPSNPAHALAAPNLSSPPKPAQVSQMKFQAQSQAFVRFAVGVAQLSKAIALNRTCVLEPFNRTGSRLENSGFHP